MLSLKAAESKKQKNTCRTLMPVSWCRARRRLTSSGKSQDFDFVYAAVKLPPAFSRRRAERLDVSMSREALEKCIEKTRPHPVTQFCVWLVSASYFWCAVSRSSGWKAYWSAAVIAMRAKRTLQSFCFIVTLMSNPPVAGWYRKLVSLYHFS